MTRQLPGRLRELREGKGLSRADLAWLSGVSLATIVSIEQGKRARPYYDIFLALAHGLGVEPHELDAPAYTPHAVKPVGRPSKRKKK